jgi:hypothetical protein
MEGAMKDFPELFKLEGILTIPYGHLGFIRS